MLPNEIGVDTYKELESKVLECLRDERVCDICVVGWKGFGASGVLRRAAEAVEKKELIGQFDTVIELAGYRSPREAQRAVAEQLNLEPAIMAKLDEADEDDDFSGVPASSRGTILDEADEEGDISVVSAGSRGMMPEVAEEIRRAVKDRRVLLLLRKDLADGQPEVIDYNGLEIPIVRRGPHKVLWTLGVGEGIFAKFPSGKGECGRLGMGPLKCGSSCRVCVCGGCRNCPLHQRDLQRYWEVAIASHPVNSPQVPLLFIPPPPHGPVYHQHATTTGSC